MKHTTLKTLKVMTTIFALALVLVAGFVTLSLSTGVTSVSASSDRKQRSLHLTKQCSEYTGLAGSFCTFTPSNLAAIKVGSKVFYDQAAGTPMGLLDSNVVLDAGGRQQGDRPLHTRSEYRSRTVHVLGRDRGVHRVPGPCRSRLQVGIRSMPLGRDVQLHSGA